MKKPVEKRPVSSDAGSKDTDAELELSKVAGVDIGPCQNQILSADSCSRRGFLKLGREIQRDGGCQKKETHKWDLRKN